MLTRLGVSFGTEGSIKAECGHTSFVSCRAGHHKSQNELTRCFVSRIITELEQKDIIPLHSLFVKPPLIRIVQDFVGFVLVMWENYIGWDEIPRVNGPEVTHCERTVLDWC